jgi:3-oxoacyl-[acyl-carrier protein] reductase
MFDLSGKTALITGASGGLGGAIAKALSRQGAKVALSGTREAALNALADEIAAAAVLPCSLSDAAAVDGLISRAEAALGGLDILISNAGVTKDGLLLRMKDEDWAQVLTVNLEAHFRLSRAALKGMMRKRWGRIIAITSVVGVTAAILGRIPAGKLGAGDDVAAAAVYLASEEAAYVTGQTLHVNGGMAMI